ncbi:MAG: aldehyde ferredoxin oxidoreductase family protein [Anaerolineae bacterium]
MAVAIVDLTRRCVEWQPPDPDTQRRFLGARGVAAHLLTDLTTPETTPLSPENPLIFSTGPLSGTPWPTGSRYHVTFKSPLTGIYGYASSGGHFGPALAQAGIDTLIILGQASEPVFLEIRPGRIDILPAGHLWGLTTDKVHDLLLQGAPRSRVACIGPAGENGVLFAGILNDYSRAAARCGGGAVMGAKRLKAIVVREQPKRSYPEAFLALARDAARRLREAPSTQGLIRLGTPVLMAPKNVSGDLPARNHQTSQVPFIHNIDGEAVNRLTVERRGCYACPIRCDRISRVEAGPYACEVGGPEYETLDALGPMCWVSDLDAIVYANRLCNDLGLDTISTGVVMAFAMECRQHGLLSDPELSLEWGDVPSLLGLIQRIAERRGIGDLLADGVRQAAQKIGGDAHRFAMHVKGMELPRQEPRVAKGFGLGHATSNRGADHLYALPTIDLAGLWDAAQRLFPPQIVPQLMDTADETYKPDLIVFTEHYCAISDALGVCKFSTAETYGLYPEDLARGLSALWGTEITSDELLLAGERIVNLERMYNVRLGLSRKDDRLPSRFTHEPLDLYAYAYEEGHEWATRSKEPIRAGALIGLDTMLDRYYALRGWNADGIPTPETLARLGL